MNTISSWLGTVLNTHQTTLTSAITPSTNHNNNNNNSIPIPSTPFPNLLIPTSTTLKSRHVRLNSTPSSGGTFDGSYRSSSSSVSASIRDLRSRCSSKGTDVAGDDWPEDAWTLGGRLMSRVEMEGADVGFLLGWLEDGDGDEAEESEDGDEDGDEGTPEHSICVMAILPSIENEDGYAPSRKRAASEFPLQDAAEHPRKRPHLAATTEMQRAGNVAGAAAPAEPGLRDAAEGLRKCRRGGSAGGYWDPVVEAAVADLAFRDAAEGSRKCQRGGAAICWDPIREAQALEDAAERSRNQMRLSFITEASQAGDAEAPAVVSGWTAINHPRAEFSARYLGS
ncbi:hypothetical protein LTR56_021136 [Elasticomyces elasticus]|nr:hypothetical protein LTR56_021136 [Elasticomyces elasticus]KAK3631811.1 hypothetical protein LTR22_020879 [Elasticomyces elasticus]KAK4909667.1 hypothetical protein LTR49_021561 [Elasticomyces elasticus]KAK5749529.1 hypothetical protein LTS12_020395 [Elasticomyces elasticus]